MPMGIPGITYCGSLRLTRAVWACGLVLALSLAGAAPAGVGQSAGVNQGGPGYIHAPAGLDPMPQHNGSEAAAKVDEMRRAERHQRVLRDAARLLALSTDLKAEVDQTPKDELSLSAMRKAAEIEKLARDMKDAMKN